MGWVVYEEWHTLSQRQLMADSEDEQKAGAVHKGGRLALARKAFLADLECNEQRMKRLKTEDALRIKELVACIILYQLEKQMRSYNCTEHAWTYSGMNDRLREAVEGPFNQVDEAFLKEHVEPLVKGREPDVSFVYTQLGFRACCAIE